MPPVMIRIPWLWTQFISLKYLKHRKNIDRLKTVWFLWKHLAHHCVGGKNCILSFNLCLSTLVVKRVLYWAVVCVSGLVQFLPCPWHFFAFHGGFHFPHVSEYNCFMWGVVWLQSFYLSENVFLLRFYQILISFKLAHFLVPLLHILLLRVVLSISRRRFICAVRIFIFPLLLTSRSSTDKTTTQNKIVMNISVFVLHVYFVYMTFNFSQRTWLVFCNCVCLSNRRL